MKSVPTRLRVPMRNNAMAKPSMVLTRLLCIALISWRLEAAKRAYHTLTEDQIGRRDIMVANGNPMKGLITNPEFYYDPSIESIDSSMDIYYIPVGHVMRDDPNVVGFESAFNWTYVEDRLEASGAKHRHSILSFAVHYPGAPLSLPGYLEGSDQVPLHWYDEFMGGGLTPDYGNEQLLSALTNFVVALAQKYDGDNRIAFIHLGLLGFWGEWHCFPLLGLVPDQAKTRIADAYRHSFNVTKLQARYPDRNLQGFGYYDGSFAFATLDGEGNGGVEQHWYFWPMLQQEANGSFWRTAPMGGETRPEIQNIIFEDSYPRRTFERQDFEESLKVTHASYMLHSDAFIAGGYNGTELVNAKRGHVLLGYNFVVTNISAIIDTNSSSGSIDVAVTVEQIGVAPFYYPLALKLSFNCSEMLSLQQLGGMESLIDQGAIATFTVWNVPATERCLENISISLESPMLLPGRTMKFAQGDGTLTFSIPIPTGTVFDAEQTAQEETVVMDQSADFDPPVDSVHTGERVLLEQQPLSVGFHDNMKVAFFYQSPRLNETDLWVPLLDGDVIEISQTVLTVEARPDHPVSAIWFSYGSTHMHVAVVAPFTLPSNKYLVSSGTKEVVVTVFVDGHSSSVTALKFEVVAPNSAFIMNPGPLVDKLSFSIENPKHETTSVRYDAHGYNTPFAPSLLQLVSLERSSATWNQANEENMPEVNKSSSTAATLHVVSVELIVSVVWSLLYLRW